METHHKKKPEVSFQPDTLSRPGRADSIHLWIIPNHMLWIPLEFEESNREVLERGLP